MTFRFRVVAAALSTLALASGCSPETVSASTTTESWLLTASGPPATMAAEFTGTLLIDTVHHCVSVRPEGSELASPVVFVQEARLELSEPSRPVLVLGDREYESGDSITLGGGFVNSPPPGEAWDDDADSYANLVLPADCWQERVFLQAG